MTKPKVYVGDSVYAEVFDNQLMLTTNNGMGDTQRIVLEPDVWASLVLYMQPPQPRAAARAKAVGESKS